MDEKRKKEILEQRAENQRTAERLTEGTAYHEPVEVYFTDKQKHTVEVFMLSQKELREATRRARVKQVLLDEFGKEAADAKLKGERFRPDEEKYEPVEDYFDAIVELAVKEPADILRNLAIGENAKIVAKAFEIMSPPKN